MERPKGHIPELQTAQLQGHALADLAGIALHVVIPELAGRKAEAETPTLIPCFPKQRPQDAWNTILSVSLTCPPCTNAYREIKSKRERLNLGSLPLPPSRTLSSADQASTG